MITSNTLATWAATMPTHHTTTTKT